MAYKFNIVIDKLEITYTASDEWREHFKNIPDRYKEKRDQLILERKDSQSYQYEFNVFYRDDNGIKRLIGLLFWGSYNKNRSNVYFCYENESLYYDKEYLLYCRFYIEEALGLKFKQISKLDIAIDSTVNIVTRFYKIFRDESYSIILNGKKLPPDMDVDITDIVGHYYGSRRHPYRRKSFHIRNNSASHDLQMVGYNKSLEIAAQSDKKYIEKAAGFGDIHRLEVRCSSHKRIKKVLDDIGWMEEDLYSKLQIEEYRLYLFENISNRLIRFSKKRKTYSLTDVIFI